MNVPSSPAFADATTLPSLTASTFTPGSAFSPGSITPGVPRAAAA